MIVAYLHRDGILTDWHGNKLGTYKVTASWRIHSWMSTHMYQVEARVDGITYTGRSLGVGMIYKGKRKAGQ